MVQHLVRVPEALLKIQGNAPTPLLHPATSTTSWNFRFASNFLESLEGTTVDSVFSHVHVASLWSSTDQEFHCAQCQENWMGKIPPTRGVITRKLRGPRLSSNFSDTPIRTLVISHRIAACK